eukprot:TRINITY_DN2275_c0_g1_i1.p1 TRINITY_DN2275_c0_g1~~TRINITY_DN2275_c0_g1_i1.p1  ORF type:complete len:324 (-),score=17.44 TRINITY_DN2275_c0_g1_i1:832-1803(-)
MRKIYEYPKGYSLFSKYGPKSVRQVWQTRDFQLVLLGRFQATFSEGYFTAPLLEKAIKTDLLKSLEDVKYFFLLAPEQKLGKSFLYFKTPPTKATIEEVHKSFTLEEAKVILHVVMTLAERFVENFTAKCWNTVVKVTSLRNIFRTQIVNFPNLDEKVQVSPELIIDLTLKVLEKDGYITIPLGDRVVYDEALFSVKRRVDVKLEDLDLNIQKDSVVEMYPDDDYTRPKALGTGERLPIPRYPEILRTTYPKAIPNPLKQKAPKILQPYVPSPQIFDTEDTLEISQIAVAEHVRKHLYRNFWSRNSTKLQKTLTHQSPTLKIR